jgi:ubiquinone biosynthesis protein Coq4
MTKLETFRRLRQVQGDTRRIGDFALYKSELVGARARPEVEARLAALPTPFPEVDLEALGALERGTLGREYVEFLHANELDAFRISEDMDPALVRRNVFTARYSLLHDVFHVLTGFDTSWAGELGVWAFVAGQRYTAAHWVAVILACLVYPILAPRQIPRLWRNLWLGRRMGRRAASLLTTELETMWDRPVVQLRRELDIEPAHELDGQLVAALPY